MKRYLYIFVMLFTVASYQVVSQENILYYNIQEAKQSKIVFQDISESLFKTSEYSF